VEVKWRGEKRTRLRDEKVEIDDSQSNKEGTEASLLLFLKHHTHVTSLTVLDHKSGGSCGECREVSAQTSAP